MVGGWIRRWVEQPAARDWCVANGVDPSRILNVTPMRRDGREGTWGEILNPDTLPGGERPEPGPLDTIWVPFPVDPGVRGYIVGWPRRETWPSLVTEAVRKAGFARSTAGRQVDAFSGRLRSLGRGTSALSGGPRHAPGAARSRPFLVGGSPQPRIRPKKTAQPSRAGPPPA